MGIAIGIGLGLRLGLGLGLGLGFLQLNPVRVIISEMLNTYFQVTVKVRDPSHKTGYGI